MAYQSAYIPNANTKLYYKLNGGATDDSGLGNNGTATNVTYIDARFGQGGSFNGISSSIAVGSNVATGSNFTVSVWQKTTNALTASKTYVRKDAAGNSCWAFGAGWAIGKARFYVVDAVSSSFISSGDSTTSVNDGRWHNIVATCSGSTIKIFVNGILENSATVTNGARIATPGTYVGSNQATSEYWNGEIDEVIIESVAWTDAQVFSYYVNSGESIGKGDISLISTSSTKLYLPFNTNCIDASGNLTTVTPTNISYIDGKFGQCASFNGTSSYVQLPNNSTLKPSSGAPKTIYLWFKGGSTYSPYGILWNGGYDVGNASDSSGFIGLNGTNVVRLTGNGTDIVDATFTHNDNAWHSLVCVMRSTGAKIYIDGTLRASGNLTFNAGLSSREPIVGAFLYGISTPSGFYNGLIDEFFTIDGESTAKEIQQYYSNAIGRYQTNII